MFNLRGCARFAYPPAGSLGCCDRSPVGKHHVPTTGAGIVQPVTCGSVIAMPSVQRAPRTAMARMPQAAGRPFVRSALRAAQAEFDSDIISSRTGFVFYDEVNGSPRR